MTIEAWILGFIAVGMCVIGSALERRLVEIRDAIRSRGNDDRT